jgi:mannose-6-phosphate isomerase-like protein (cupin superfamily)
VTRGTALSKREIPMDRTTFESELAAAGYGAAVEREREPDRFDGAHAHAFDARLLILAGDFTLTRGGETCTYRAGEAFEVPAGTPHSERCGPAGVRYLVARRYR